MIFPYPRHLEVVQSVACCASVAAECEEKAFVEQVFGGFGIVCADDAQLVLRTVKRNNAALTYITESNTVTKEKYIINSCREGDKIIITIEYAYLNGLYYALLCLSQQIKAKEIILGVIEDYPLFSCRGFIEGFYGKPWSAEEREDMLVAMSRKRMNTYYYAPKDDPWHRDKWRELYPKEQFDALSRLVGLCKELFIDFHYCIAPGLSMRYTSEEDYSALYEKLMSLYKAGVRGFGLLLDDIPETLYYEEDKQRFDYETVNAHIYLANRLYNDLQSLDSSVTLTVCPLQYHGKGNEYFISKLGREIDPRIMLFWTGSNICSQELTVPEAFTFISSTNHKPLYWDNFPVNDAEMYHEMHLGFLSGRDSGLYRYSQGLISNCMEYCECSKIPLMTVADYLWNPEAYNARESWENALAEMLGEEAELFEYFADNLLFSCLKVENSPLFNQRTNLAMQKLGAGEIEQAIQVISEYAGNLCACCEMIKKGERKIYRELSRWADKQLAASSLLNNALALVTGASDITAAQVEKEFAQYRRIPEVLYDFSFVALIERLLNFNEN